MFLTHHLMYKSSRSISTILYKTKSENHMIYIYIYMIYDIWCINIFYLRSLNYFLISISWEETYDVIVVM